MDTCQYTPPPAIVELVLESKYGDDGNERDTIDPVALAAYEKAMAPVTAFEKQVVQHSASGRVDCTLRFLYTWASADALSVLPTETSVSKAATTISGLGEAYRRLNLGLYDDPRQTKIRQWFKNRAKQIRSFYTNNASAYPRSSKNNHRYWAGFSTTVVGIIAQDKGLRDWGYESFKVGVCSANIDGSLPLEMERGSKAGEYQMYATTALTAIAERLRPYKHNVDTVCDSKYQKILDYTGSISINQPSYRLGFAALYPYPFKNKETLLSYGAIKVTDLGGGLP